MAAIGGARSHGDRLAHPAGVRLSAHAARNTEANCCLLTMPAASSILVTGALRTKISQQVYDWLLRRLLARELKPGDQVNRRQVAEQLGISVAPVLEAMVQLEWEGFLHTRPRIGTVVAQPDAQKVLGRMILREALEAQAARLCCGAPVCQHRVRLLDLAERVDASDARVEANWRAEIAFHRSLVELTGCQELVDAFDQVARHSLFHAVNELLPPPSQKRDPHAHVGLMQVLMTAGPDQAEAAMRRHLEARRVSLLT